MALKKLFFTFIAAATFGITACDDYDDGALWDAVNDHESRLEALEQWQEQVNGNIAALQQLLSTTDYITKVTPVMEDGRQTGYTIEFLHQSPITIYNGEKGDKGDPGEDGQDGHDGQDGADGQDGVDGQDGQTPEIGLVKDEAGDWYWTLNGELMLDQDGNPIRANGHDGADGEPGQDGQDGHDGQAGEPGQPGEAGTPGKPGADAPTPQIKLGSTLAGNTCYGIDGKKEDSPAESAWYLSVDDGKTWYRVSGEKGAAGDDGDKGEKGDKGDAWLACAPEMSADGLYYTFTLSDDDNANLNDNPTFNVPVYLAFSLGTDALDFSSGTAEMEITLPGGTTTDDYQAIVAQITPEGADGTYTDIATRAGEGTDGWSVEAKFNSDNTATLAITAGASIKAVLRVTLIRNDGSELAASRIVEQSYKVENGTYIVYNATGLRAWAEALKDAPATNCTLAADITFPDVAEGESNWTHVVPCSGIFDGAGHTVSNVVVNDETTINVGFLYGIVNGGTIKNLNLANAIIHGEKTSVGGIVGTVGSGANVIACSVSNCIITGNNNVGGIAGRASLDDDGCITACSVSNSDITGDDRVGGIVGSANQGDDGYIIACSVSNSDITGDDRVGGIAGRTNEGHITACYTTADVYGSSHVGAFVCYNEEFVADGETIITAGYWQTDSQESAVGFGESGGTTRVEGTVTWKTATEEMNRAIPTDVSCPYRFVQKDGENNPPVIEKTGE